MRTWEFWRTSSVVLRRLIWNASDSAFIVSLTLLHWISELTAFAHVEVRILDCLAVQSGMILNLTTTDVEVGSFPKFYRFVPELLTSTKPNFRSTVPGLSPCLLGGCNTPFSMGRTHTSEETRAWSRRKNVCSARTLPSRLVDGMMECPPNFLVAIV